MKKTFQACLASAPSLRRRSAVKVAPTAQSANYSNSRSSRSHLAKSVAREVFARTRSASFQREVKALLLELCRINTTPHSVVAGMRAAEAECFRVLERELAALEFRGLQLERRPIDPSIQTHPAYSLLHFTKTPERPEGLTPEETYANRANLLCLLPGNPGGGSGRSVGLNAHVDVVAPYFPPRARGGTVHGRGACDDKGPVVCIVAALKVLAEAMAKTGLTWNRDVLAMFVVEEETGGNGSLSLALDRDLKRHYDSLLVGECTDLKFHPANRGAVWYQATLSAPAGVSPLELFAFVLEEIEKEGAAIRAESRHPLFPQRPVQTCHGILGPWGEHPSRICSEVGFTVQFERAPTEQTQHLLRDCLEAGLVSYLGLYGDKTKVTDPATGRPVVARHYDCRPIPHGFRVEVHGAAGHMGAIRERDGALTKMAHLVRSLCYSKAKLAATGGPVRFDLATLPGKAGLAVATAPARGRLARSATGSAEPLVLEGGQGFVPTHSLDEVMVRLRQAAQRGAETCLRRLGRTERGGQLVTVAYQKLHNVAFDGDPNSVTVRNAQAAAAQCGLRSAEPVLGWTVSCDARLFATEYPGLEVLTFGPGQLAYAHSDQEQIELEDMRAAVEFLALFLLRQTGTLP